MRWASIATMPLLEKANAATYYSLNLNANIMTRLFNIIMAALIAPAIMADPFALPQPAQLTLKHYAMQYADAEKLAKKINVFKNHLRSKGGYAISDKKTNQLWVYDDKAHLVRLSKLITLLDTMPKQIMIKAIIVMIDRESISQLGTYFEESHDNETGGSYKNALSMLHLPLIKFDSQNSLTITLTALEKKGHAMIISEPSIITLNRHTAKIASGDEIPYSQKTEETNTTLFKKALLELQVTPDLLPNNKILLNITMHQDKPGTLLIDGVPTIKTQQLNTSVYVSNKRTIVLGGIHEQSVSTEQSHVPLLNKIPLLGKLFQNKQRQGHQQQLLIFITPQVLPS